MSLRQSMYTGLAQPEVKMKGFSSENSTAFTSSSMRAVVWAIKARSAVCMRAVRKSRADSSRPGAVNAARPGALQFTAPSMRGDDMVRVMPWVALAAGALIAIPLAVNAQSFRCVGKDGKKYYGQTIPNQCIGQPVEQLDKQGIVVRRIENQSPEDKAIKKAEDKKKGEEAATKKEEDRRNRALLATYSSEKDIEEARARALTDNEQAVKDVTRRIEEIKKRQVALAGEMEFYKKNPAPAKLQNDVKSAQVDLDSQQNLLEGKKKEVDSINARYDEDKRRFAALTSKK